MTHPTDLLEALRWRIDDDLRDITDALNGGGTHE